MSSHPDHPCFKLDEQGDLLLEVLVVPGSSRTKIEGLHGDGAQQSLRIRLQAPPVDGQANAALLRALAQILGLHARDLQIDRGHSSRHKQLRITAAAVPRIAWNALQRALQN
ncbi:MAG: DUF167 domain-containing protein [Betaproteobacteria bacterium]